MHICFFLPPVSFRSIYYFVVNRSIQSRGKVRGVVWLFIVNRRWIHSQPIGCHWRHQRHITGVLLHIFILYVLVLRHHMPRCVTLSLSDISPGVMMLRARKISRLGSAQQRTDIIKQGQKPHLRQPGTWLQRYICCCGRFLLRFTTISNLFQTDTAHNILDIARILPLRMVTHRISNLAVRF